MGVRLKKGSYEGRGVVDFRERGYPRVHCSDES